MDRGARCRASLGLSQMVADCIAHQFDYRVDAELAHQRGAVSFDRLDADTQFLSYPLVAMPFRQQLDDFTFARCQPRRRPVISGNGATARAQEPAQDSFGDLRTEIWLPF